MKKITFFYLFLLLSLFLNAQDISWSTPIKTNNAKEVVEYLGSVNDNNYFISFSNNANMFSSSLEVYFFKTNSKNELAETSEVVVFDDTEVLKAFIKDDRINLLVKEYEKKSYIVENIVFDIKTLKESKGESKVLVQFEIEKSDKVIIYYAESKDKSKYCLNYLAIDKKTSKGYLQMNVFEYDNTLLWTNKFDNDFEGTLNIHDFHIENSGEVYLYASNKIPVANGIYDYKLVVIKNDDSGGKEFEFNADLDKSISSMSFHVIDSNTIFLATLQDNDINTYKLDIEKEDIISTYKFKVYDGEEDSFNWTLSKFYQLENGNLVLPIENKKSMRYIAGSASSYSYTNSEITFVVLSPEDNQVLTKTYISRCMNFSTNKDLSHGYFETPYYFTNESDFYAIYNNNIALDDLVDDGINYAHVSDAKGSKYYHSVMLKIDESGKPKVNKLFSMKKDKRMFSPYTSFINSNNELIVSGGNVKGFSFMKYNYK